MFAVASSSRPAGEVAALAVELGLSALELRARLAEQRPVQEAASAVQVIQLHRQLRRHGFEISTKPSFPWPLTVA